MNDTTKPTQQLPFGGASGSAIPKWIVWRLRLNMASGPTAAFVASSFYWTNFQLLAGAACGAWLTVWTLLYLDVIPRQSPNTSGSPTTGGQP